jgi:nucleotide-binding universal stress UspA family protein
MKRILVPTDFSDNATHALRVAARIAGRSGGGLEIIHANTAIAYVPPLPEYYPVESFNLTDYNDTATEALYALKQQLAADPVFQEVPIETRLEEGLLYSTIRRVAQEDGVDLIVMGSRGATGALEFLVGSNTEKVIRTAPCPVLAVPERSGEFDPKTVVLATTLRPDQGAAFLHLSRWQELFGFDVRLLYLNNPAGFDTDQAIRQAAETFAGNARLQNVTAFVSTNTFNEEASILAFAHEHAADLIVMGTHQRQGLSHLLFGSLTEDTVNHSDIPVLSIPVRR